MLILLRRRGRQLQRTGRGDNINSVKVESRPRRGETGCQQADALGNFELPVYKIKFGLRTFGVHVHSSLGRSVGLAITKLEKALIGR